MKIRHRCAIFLVSIISFPAISLAGECPASTELRLPAAREGAIGYNQVDRCLFFCDGVSWTSSCHVSIGGGGTPPPPSTDPEMVNICVEAEDSANGPSSISSTVTATSPAGAEMRSSFGNEHEYVTFKPITVPQAGNYVLDYHYASAEDPSSGLVINGGAIQTVYLGTSHIQSNYASWFIVKVLSTPIVLQNGANLIRIQGHNTGGAFSLDKICIRGNGT